MKQLASILLIGLPQLALAGAAATEQESGWSGSLGVGVGYYQVSSSFVKTQNDNKRTISTLNQAPASDNYFTALPEGSLLYTLPDKHTQLFLGLAPVENLGLGSTLQLGARHQFDDKGVLSAGFTYDQKEVWTDPYALNVVRSDTNIKSSGIGANWDHILGSGVTASLAYNKITLGQESSGQGAGLSSGDQALLRRNGNSVDTQIGYALALDSSGTQTITPSVLYSQYNADGDAMRSKRSGVKLEYAFKSEAHVFNASLIATQTRYDAGNPLFAGAKADSRDYLFSATYIHNQLFGYKPWSAFATALYGKSNSDIHFFDAKVSALNAGVSYRF